MKTNNLLYTMIINESDFAIDDGSSRLKYNRDYKK